MDARISKRAKIARFISGLEHPQDSNILLQGSPDSQEAVLRSFGYSELGSFCDENSTISLQQAI